MTATEIIANAKERMKKTEDALQRELGGIRAGRANASLLDRLQVEYYGVPTPVNQLASVTVPEARMLLITPYDKSSLQDIERVVRLVIPQLTEERRKELAKQVGKEAEGAKVSVRNIRRDAIEHLKKAEKNKEITEDDLRGYEKDIQKLTDDSVKNIDHLAQVKEKELLEV